MQNNDMVEKLKVFIDGIEWKGLVRVDEVPWEKIVVDVPEINAIRKMSSSTVQFPVLNMTYKCNRKEKDTTLKGFKDWFKNNEMHNVMIKRCDAHGEPFENTMFTDCECAKVNIPPYDAGSPTFSQIQVILVPYDSYNSPL